MAGIQIGKLLVEQGVLTERQVRHILTVQKASHRPFGDLAERLYGVDPHVVENAWVTQYVDQVGQIDLADHEVDSDCLRLLNRRQAWQFHLLPIGFDGESLQMAACAEELIRVVNFTSRTIREPVYFMIADRGQLQEYLMKHYPVPEYIAQYAARL